MVKTAKGIGTRESIMESAINLFSEKGYDATSIRDISGKVGINEASIYNHYKNKEDIMDSIIESFIAGFSFNATEVPMEELIEKYGPEGFVNNAVRSSLEHLKEPRIGKINRLICIELFHNKKVRGFFKETFMEPSYMIWEQIFRKMMDLGYIKESDASMLAAEFFNYCVYLYFNYFIIRYEEASYETLIESMIKDLSRHTRFIFEAVKAGRT
jgi:AcrR family transcriptional regulator